MSLDFALIGESGKPEEDVSMGLRSWWHVVSPTANSDYPLIDRMADYYKDAIYEPAELADLIEELEGVRRDLAQADQLAADMLALCRKAEEKGRSIMAIAD
jgi:hypothetical protein